LEGRVFLNGAWSGLSPIDVNPQPLPPRAALVSADATNFLHPGPPADATNFLHGGATGGGGSGK
jgi:hypothetical protein